jgi:putative ABC transport system permease protein
VSWSGTAIVLSLSICMLVGVGFGVFPAIKASKLNPIDALHSD